MALVPAHGGDLVGFAKLVGCRVDEVIDLSSNINFLKPNMGLDFNAIEPYAYPNYEALAEQIAHHYGALPSELELFNGATVAIHSLFRHLNLKRVMLYAPLYGEYRRAAEIYGYKVTLVNRFESMEETEIVPNALVVFVNPSTPDGDYYELLNLLKRWEEAGCTVLVDESFLEFTPHPSMIKHLSAHNRLYVLKSMTKFYGAAGIRVGGLFSWAKNIASLHAKEPLWKLSTFDAHYIQSALEDSFFPKLSRIVLEENREALISLLSGFEWVEKIYPSSANYLLIKLQKINAFDLQEYLMLYKIMVRNCANFDFLDQYHVRIAIKERELMSRLEEALCEISI